MNHGLALTVLRYHGAVLAAEAGTLASSADGWPGWVERVAGSQGKNVIISKREFSDPFASPASDWAINASPRLSLCAV